MEEKSLWLWYDKVKECKRRGLLEVENILVKKLDTAGQNAFSSYFEDVCERI